MQLQPTLWSRSGPDFTKQQLSSSVSVGAAARPGGTLPNAGQLSKVSRLVAKRLWRGGALSVGRRNRSFRSPPAHTVPWPVPMNIMSTLAKSATLRTLSGSALSLAVLLGSAGAVTADNHPTADAPALDAPAVPADPASADPASTGSPDASGPPPAESPAAAVGAATAAPTGAPRPLLALDGTPHLWVLDEQQVARWAGDTRALTGLSIDWGDVDQVTTGELAARKLGDPHLTLGLLKIGDPIYLVKWETTEAAPSLFHIQCLRDVELFGIGERNYGAFVLDQQSWEQRYGIATAALRRTQLATTCTTTGTGGTGTGTQSTGGGSSGGGGGGGGTAGSSGGGGGGGGSTGGGGASGPAGGTTAAPMSSAAPAPAGSGGGGTGTTPTLQPAPAPGTGAASPASAPSGAGTGSPAGASQPVQPAGQTAPATTADKEGPAGTFVQRGADSGGEFVVVSLRDAGSGLSSISVRCQSNATAAIPQFGSGTKDSVSVRVSTVSAGSNAVVVLSARDVAGNTGELVVTVSNAGTAEARC